MAKKIQPTETPEQATRTLWSPLSGANVPWSIEVSPGPAGAPGESVAHLIIADPVAGVIHYQAPTSGLRRTLNEWIAELDQKEHEAKHPPKKH